MEENGQQMWVCKTTTELLLQQLKHRRRALCVHVTLLHNKLASLTFKIFDTDRPPYLADLVQYYQPARCLRSSGSHQLVIPRHNLSLGSRGFSISAPHIWNSLPINIRKIQSVSTFRRHPKNPLLSVRLFYPAMRPDSFTISALCTSFTYLLTYNHLKTLFQ